MNRFTLLDTSEKNPKENMGYSNEFQAMLDGLDDEDSLEESNCSEKKRRLSIDQVQALERIFEVDNKLDPERKMKLAQELGLQPRQVAIWFQNRRARWKTKQLERDYHVLKANYEALQLCYSKVEEEKEGLIAELRDLKEKLGEDNVETNDPAEKKVATLLSSPNVVVPEKYNNDSGEHELMYKNGEMCRKVKLSSERKGMVDFKEGLSDSDSSGVLNEDGIGNHLNLQQQPPLISRLISCPTTTFNGLDHSVFALSAPVYHPHLLDSRDYHHQVLRMEEPNHFSVDDSCNFFAVEQGPPVFWYCSDPRNQ